MGFLYLGVLLLSLAGMTVLDWRYGLFFFSSPVRAAVVLMLGIAFFLAWDLCGIHLGIFFRAEAPIMTGVVLAPELPLEEVFFLAFLCYLTMILFTGLSRRLHTGRFRPADPTPGPDGP
jgi:lycopene cyclase domain-containing protein